MDGANLSGMLSRPLADLRQGHRLEGPRKHGTRFGITQPPRFAAISEIHRHDDVATAIQILVPGH